MALKKKEYTYADYLTIVSQHPRVDEAASQLQDYLKRLEEWLTTNRMSAEGSEPSLVTPHKYTTTFCCLNKIKQLKKQTVASSNHPHLV